MKGYRVFIPFSEFPTLRWIYSLEKPSNGAEECELPVHIAACFDCGEKGEIDFGSYTLISRPLHAVWVDYEGDILKKTYKI